MTDEQAKLAAFTDRWNAAKTGRRIDPGPMQEGMAMTDYWAANDIGLPIGPPRYVDAPAGQDTTVYQGFTGGVFEYRPGEGVKKATL